ncbi:MAG: poly-beta-1,6-N-acetyl-D-glucosamine synthase [Dissulfurispiraceae bacterium]|jgi:biofilm PGA synthesis N-glycosyltransferase PgaC|nr:poly-beta-1,6-N-acetyl-D-glucosamine synthase [Dissulfurispiraceae bacterium]
MKTIILFIVQFINDFVYMYPLFMSFVWMFGAILFFIRRERTSKQVPKLKHYPLCSIIIPCHNEEYNIHKTISWLATAQKYPDFEIVAVDDGSTDSTAEILHTLSANYPNVRTVYLKENQGKGAALTAGTLVANGDIIVTIDADALLDQDALSWIVWHFNESSRVGAVTGNPRVLNRTTLLAKIQTGEYATIIGLIKRSQRILGKVLTVSGVIAAFRRQALESAGYWDTDMVTEDIAITWKLERKFWDVRYEPKAITWVFVPETIKGLWRQRSRWAQGGMEVLKRNVDIFSDWRQRRLWPVFIEYLFSALWAYTFWTLVFLWIIKATTGFEFGIALVPPIPPQWTGAILALTCLVQFSVSAYIDQFYDKKLFKYLFWVIWYPFIYWTINALTVVFATPKALFKRKGIRAVWKSPDRGLGIR